MAIRYSVQMPDCADWYTSKYRAWLIKYVGRLHWQLYGPGSTSPETIQFESAEDALAFKLTFNLNEVNSTN